MAQELSLNGEMVLRTSTGGSVRLRLDGPGGNIWAGGNGQDGDLVMFRTNGDNQTLAQASIHLDANGGNIWAGSNGADGDLVLLPSSANNINDLSQASIHLDANGGNIWAGSNGRDGDLVLLPASATNINDLSQASIHLDANGGNIWAGGNGRDGDLVLLPSSATNVNDLSQASIHLDANGGNIWAGGNGRDGDVVLFPSTATNINDLSQATIHLNGQAGDITLLNADCAEDFDVNDGETFEPGDVVVLGNDSRLMLSQQAYDKTVAGVVAGAGDYKPGIILGRDSKRKDRVPVALLGRVCVKADTSNGPIGVGDLLTTSERAGHAMRAADCERAFGAVIGKALAAMKKDVGLIPVLVALQ